MRVRLPLPALEKAMSEQLKYVGVGRGLWHIARSGRKPKVKTRCGRTLKGNTTRTEPPGPGQTCIQCIMARNT